MNRIKRLLAGILALTLAFSMFTACTDNAGSDKGSQTTAVTTNTTEENREEEPQEVKEFCFSQKSGFYDSDFVLKLYHPDKDAKIYYTTDGSTPDETDTAYTEEGIALKNRTSEKNLLASQKDTTAGDYYKVPHNIDKGNVIRALAVLPDGTRETINGTFFVGIDREKKYSNVPVISILTDQENLFDYETGIYVTGKTHDLWLKENNHNQWLDAWQHKGNYSNKGKDWERPVNVEFLPADNSDGFCQDMGVRIMGGASRGNNQKSLRLIADEDYGKKNVKYPLIPDNLKSDGSGEVEKYKSFVLRDGGNDCDYAKIRDPLLQQLVRDRNFETMQFTPVVVFIDGEYWGVYTLAEDYTDNYIQNNYTGIDNENVVIIKNGSVEEGEDSDKELFDYMYDYITKLDMSVDENYQKASQLLDMQSFIDYCAFNIYIHNEDSFFKCNNWRMWRVRDTVDGVMKADGKWRLMAFDTDYSSGIYSGGESYYENSISQAINAGNNGNYPAALFTSLLKNQEFKKDFVLAMCDLRNVNFENNNVKAQLDQVSEVYKDLVPDTFKRFGPQWVCDQNSISDYYNGKLWELQNFFNGRYKSFVGIIKKAMSLGDAYEVTILSDNKKGEVFLNENTKVSLSKDFSGKYFSEYGLTLEALEENGARFVEWKTEGCEISDAKSKTAQITITGDCKITAVFE